MYVKVNEGIELYKREIELKAEKANARKSRAKKQVKAEE
jgi:hypothetical protein